MAINLTISHKDIKSSNIDTVLMNLETIIEDSEMVRKYENSIVLNFVDIEFLDLVKKLGEAEFKNWFSLLDREMPALPYFLSEKGSSLLIYLMGALKFNEKGSNIFFEPVDANRFFREKIREIRNLCLSNNIDPQGSISRLARLINDPYDEKEPEPEPDTKKEMEAAEENDDKDSSAKGSELSLFLEKYGSIAVLTSSKAVFIAPCPVVPGRAR